MTPDTPADGEALAEAIAEAVAYVRQAEPVDEPWRASTFGHGPLPNAIATILNAVLSGALIPRPAEPAQAAQVDVMVNLYVELENLLAVYSEPDKQLCCDGHMCGCQGATEYQQAEHYAKAALDEARAALQHKDDTHGPE